MKILKHLLWIAAVYFAAGAAYGQQSLLWRVTDTVQHRTSYVYAITDFQQKSVFVFPDAIGEAFSSADFYTPQLELSDDNVNTIANAVLMPGNKSLPDTMKSDDFLFVKERIAQTMHQDVGTYLNYRPFAVMKAVRFMRSQPNSKVSLAYHFDGLAHKANKEIIGLESVTEQLHFNNLLPLEAVAHYFRNTGLYDSIDAQMLKAYQSADLQRYYELSVGGDAWQAHRKTILAERNHLMVNRLRTAMQSGSIFATCMAEHLAGPSGILHLLRSYGYKVEPVLKSESHAAKFVEAIEWKLVSEPGEGFRIQFPGAYSKETQTIESELGPLSTTMYRCEAQLADPNVFYTMSYTDYPAHVIHSDYKDMWDEVFNNSGDALIEALDGQLLEESSITHKGFPGRETVAVFDNGQKAAFIRSFLIENRLYILQVICERDRLRNSFITRFLDSFQLQ